jgi:ATP-dependent RNA helicase DeaD
LTGVADDDTPLGFADLGLRPKLVDALAALGYEEPTPIQAEAIPAVLTGRDLLGQAATGTGKTAAFALPILERLAERTRSNEPAALVLVPTRELAMQVSEAFHRYGQALGARVLPIYGGQPIGRQLAALHRGVDVVVATPGRAIDHLGRKTLLTNSIQTVVLDEADEMLAMGFAEDIEAILEATPAGRQTVLFSATLPPRITAIANKHLTDPTRIHIAAEKTAAGVAPKVRQVAYVVARAHKPTALGRILDVEAPGAAIVFCRTRVEVDQLTQTLNGRGYRAEALHGGMDQAQRDRVMGRLRSSTADLLVATDVAARGLDIDHLTHVVNYDVPSEPEAYVHRIGRVGRAGREGVAITLVEPREHRQLKNIERLTRQSLAVEKVPTIADLRDRRMEQLLATMREAILEGDTDPYRVVVETLTDDFDAVEIALAALKLADEATSGAVEDDDIPDVSLHADKPSSSSSRPKRGGGTSAGKARVWVSIGRQSRCRPNDLVGAFTGETSLRGKEIGAIEITEKFSFVEVPDDRVDEIVKLMNGSTIRGRKVTVRRDTSS